MISFPLPPERVSLPASPRRVSSPSPASKISLPSPPKRESFPPRETKVSSPPSPLNVLSNWFPVIVSLWTFEPLIFSMSIKVSVSIVAFAMLALTSASERFTVTAPSFSKLAVSLPLPPSSLSFPASPLRRSSPSLPMRVSLPAPPKSVSSPAAPFKILIVELPLMISSPKAEPLIFSIFCIWSLSPPTTLTVETPPLSKRVVVIAPSPE